MSGYSTFYIAENNMSYIYIACTIINMGRVRVLLPLTK